jgi:hypothetical protein
MLFTENYSENGITFPFLNDMIVEIIPLSFKKVKIRVIDLENEEIDEFERTVKFPYKIRIGNQETFKFGISSNPERTEFWASNP